MTQVHSHSPPLDVTLEQALQAPGIPQELDARARRVLERLRTPVRVVVLGPERSGKSALIDMLLEQTILGQQPKIPIIELCFGDTATVGVEDHDGRITTLPGHLVDFDITRDILSVQQQLPLEFLRDQTVTEITVDGSATQKQAILRYAADYADVLIWCSSTFNPAEQALWAQVPDARKDNSFLALTLADQTVNQAALPKVLERVAPVAQHEFLGIYPVSALQEVPAQGATHETGLWRSSGGQQLRADLLQQLRTGRMADADHAEWMLRQLTLAASVPGTALRAPAGRAADDPPSATEDKPEAKGQGDTVLNRALSQLQSRAQDMLAEAGDLDPQSEAVLAQCLEAAREMTSTLMAAGGTCPELNAAQEVVEEGEEMLMLLQLEQNDEAALDAVTVLLQLKKEMTQPPLMSERAE